jgi:hypothetical protein
LRISAHKSHVSPTLMVEQTMPQSRCGGRELP